MGSSPTAYLSVLRFGPTHENVSATILKNAVLDHFHRKHQELLVAIETDVDESAAQGGNEQGDQQGTLSETTGGRFQVANRYFKAQLIFQSVDNPIAEGDNAAGLEVTDGLFHKEDGIVLAFDAARSNPDLPMSLAASFDSLNSVHDRAVENGGGDLLRLCVGVSMGPMDASELRGREYEEEYSRRILWCLDRGYEYVEADLSPQGLAKGHDERDKEGFARIVEAIAGTVWSSAVMEKSKTQQLKQSYQETAQQQRIADDEDGKTNEENNYLPPDPSLLAKSLDPSLNNGDSEEKEMEKAAEISDEARLEQARQALLQDSEAEDDDRLLSTTDDACDREKIAKERDQERRMDQLDGALKQAASIREMSRSGKMTDEERRQRAGDAAVVLMNLMHSMGLDEDDDSEPDGE